VMMCWPVRSWRTLMPMPTRGGGACAFEAEVDPADIPATRNGPLLSLRADEAQLCGPQ